MPTLTAIIRILVSVLISIIILQLLKKKDKVKSERITIIGLISSIHGVFRLAVSMIKVNLELSNFVLVDLAIVVIGLLILFIWGLKRNSKDERAV